MSDIDKDRMYGCPCSWCDQLFATVEGVQDHVNSEHEPELIPSEDDYEPIPSVDAATEEHNHE